MQLSWLQVCLFCWQVIMQYCSDPAAIRMHCETTGVWLKVVFPNAWSSDCWRKKSSWVIKAECWGNFCSFKQSCLWLKLSTFCHAFLGKMLFVHFWWWWGELKPLVFSRCNLKISDKKQIPNKQQSSRNLTGKWKCLTVQWSLVHCFCVGFSLPSLGLNSYMQEHSEQQT